MRSRLNIWKSLLVGVVAMTATTAWAVENDLPQGVSVRTATDGLMLTSSDGRPLYRLDIDRAAKRARAYFGNLIEQRCADVCARYWRPVAAPAGFAPHGDWTVTDKGAVHQINYKGDPLYTFEGKSFDEVAAISIQPSYMSGYTAPPTLLEDGVPVATLYWHAATYQPAPPKVTAPTGVTVQWSKAAYVFADFHKQTLYAPKSGQVCNIECDGLKPFPAPLAARAMGDWRPEQDKSGARYWAYRGNPVYRAADVTAEPPASRWQPLDL